MSAAAFTTSSIHAVSASTVNYELPRLTSRIKRKIFESGLLPNGQKYSVVGLNPLDAGACYDLCEAEYKLAEQLGKSYLLRRTPQEIQHMMDFDRNTRQGGIVLGTVIGGDRLAAIGAIDLIDDEKDAGRGDVYNADGACPIENQIYFKMATAHPSVRGQGLDLTKLLYPYRLAVGLWFEERQCFLTKVSGEKTKKFYDKDKDNEIGWKVVGKYRLPEADNPAFDLTEEEKVLNTYLLTRDDALKKLKDDYPHVYGHLEELKKAFSDFTNYKNSVTQSPAEKLALT